MTQLGIKILTWQENSILLNFSKQRNSIERKAKKFKENIELLIISKVDLYFNIELITSTSCDLRGINLPIGFWGIDFCLDDRHYVCEKERVGYTQPSYTTPPMTGICAEGWRGDTTTTHCYQVRYGLITFNFIHDLLGILIIQIFFFVSIC